jgi:hypothetical protein
MHGMKLLVCLALSTLAIVACTHAAPRLIAPGPSVEAFGELDADHDGEISAAEFAQGLAGVAEPGEAAQVFRRLDLDHDGKLAVAEYFPEPRAR